MKAREEYNSYMRDYMRKRFEIRRAEAISFLGGKCVKCGSDKNLDIDHINPDEKSFSIGKIWMHNSEKRFSELKKCQLLCENCHTKKTTIEVGKKPAIGTHGTLSSYRYCKCSLCKKAKSDYMAEYLKTHVRKRDQ